VQFGKDALITPCVNTVKLDGLDDFLQYMDDGKASAHTSPSATR